MIIYMNTKIKQNIIIIASTLHETKQNKCVCKIAPYIQEGIMGVMIKIMFNDRPKNHDTWGQSIIILYKDLVTTPFLESKLHTNSRNQYWCTCQNIIISAGLSWI